MTNPTVGKPRFNRIARTNGEWQSIVGEWTVTYPSYCNGRLSDIAFVTPGGWGPSDFVHFDPTTGEPYGTYMPEAVRKRVQRMRETLRRNVWGTVLTEVGDGYCPHCERGGGGHYDVCPTRLGEHR